MSDPTRELRRQRAITETFDVLIIGGGIVGAAAARDAAWRGYEVLLLEAVDYAFGTSSRSSKLLHGGLRYLEQGEIGLVREALLEREIFLRAAPHLCRPQKAIFPILPGRTRPSWQVRLGLLGYDFLAGKIFGRRHEALFHSHERLSSHSEESLQLREFGLEFSDLYAYWDGQMEDTRLVIEHVLDAQELGATLLNHAAVSDIQEKHRHWEVAWEDRLTGECYHSKARFIINAGGPWAEEIMNFRQGRTSSFGVRYSRGTHLVFDCDLHLPALTLSASERGRVYFVLPYFSPACRGTLVGTTERELQQNEQNPTPSEDEVAELLSHLSRDLPGAGLTRDKLYRSFAGMRVLVPRRMKSKKETSSISRKERFALVDGMLHILGGKYTTARHTAEKALDFADVYFGKRTNWKKREALVDRALPGGMNFSSNAYARLHESIKEQIHLHSPLATVEEVLRATNAVMFRLGMRAEQLFEIPEAFQPRHHFSFLAGEAKLAASKEHAATSDDIILRRLILQSFPGTLDDALNAR